MAKIPVMPVGGESGGVVFGTYTGNGSTSRNVPLGFRPKAVLVFRRDGSVNYGNNGYGGYYGGLALDGYPCKTYYNDSQSQTVVSIYQSGFTVYYQDGNSQPETNSPNWMYYYIAFR